MTLVSSGLASSFDQDELHAVLAHEMGHVLADHVGLMTTFEMVQMVVYKVLRGAPLAGLPMLGVYYALLEWSRAAELTADRASALGTGDPLLTCRTLMRMAGGPVKGLSLDAFINQATEYEGEGDPFTRYSRFWEEIGATHPFPVRRVRELVEWVASVTSTVSVQVATCAVARSHPPRRSSTRLLRTTGTAFPRCSSGPGAGCNKW